MDDEHAKLDLSSASPLPNQQFADRPPKVFPRLSARLRLAMWLAFIGGPVVLRMAGYEAYRGYQLKTAGKQIAGRMHSNEALDTGKGRTSYQLVVDYKPPEGDTTYRQRFVVSQTDYEQATRGGEITVTYLPSDPLLAAIGQRTGKESEMFAIGVGVLLFASGVWWFLKRQAARVEEFVTRDLRQPQ